MLKTGPGFTGRGRSHEGDSGMRCPSLVLRALARSRVSTGHARALCAPQPNGWVGQAPGQAQGRSAMVMWGGSPTCAGRRHLGPLPSRRTPGVRRSPGMTASLMARLGEMKWIARIGGR